MRSRNCLLFGLLHKYYNHFQYEKLNGGISIVTYKSDLQIR